IPKKFLSIALCIIVTAEMGATAIIGVDTVGITGRSGYPKESRNVARVLSHIDKWTESETPDIFRVEATNTQTLNDGSLNGYNGISVFNSMANVSITKYADSLGCSGWQAGNRYLYYESSPVTNTLLNLRYVLARDGASYTGDYLKEVDRANNVSLYENTAYVNMGFMTDSSLLNYTVDNSTVNPFENQNEFWKLATGIEEPLYTQLTVKDVGHSSSDLLSYSKSGEGMYSFSSKDSTSDKHLKFNFYPEEDSQLFAYFYVSNAEEKGSIYINDDMRNSINVKQPYISAIGNKTAGDKISLYCKLKPSGSSSVRVFCYALNQDVFDKGVEMFRENTLNTTAAGDTYLEGTINVETEGLLYTSIPYEKGWTVTVDGKEAEMAPVGEAMCAVKLTEGEHTVRFSYVPDGFKLGMLAFSTALLILVFMSVCTSKKFREKAFAKPVVWLCDTSYKKKVRKRKNTEESETLENPEDLNSDISETDIPDSLPTEDTPSDEN
ncbi:MAG: YfhO family protein, partial [Ruminococcus sp.]|nr:YfhO family protein [Ruminococcus sp.]